MHLDLIPCQTCACAGYRRSISDVPQNYDCLRDHGWLEYLLRVGLMMEVVLDCVSRILARCHEVSQVHIWKHSINHFPLLPWP